MSDDPVDVALRALNARSHPGTLSREAGEFFLAAAYEADLANIRDPDAYDVRRWLEHRIRTLRGKQ